LASPEEILENALRRVTDSGESGTPLSFVLDSELARRVELISRNPQNRAAVRLVLACALAKAENSARDARMPYTEIGSDQAFSGRSLDERYIGPFSQKYRLPLNETTAFLTPALRNRNSVLVPELDMVGRPPEVYRAALLLLTDLQENRVAALDLLAEVFRCLILLREEKDNRLELLLKSAREAREGTLPLSSEEIVLLLEQHLKSPNASRLPVLMVVAAYQATGVMLGEMTRNLHAHNAADKQTGAVGDVEVLLRNDQSVVTGYEMKDKRIAIADIDIAVRKITEREDIQNYIFILYRSDTSGLALFTALDACDSFRSRSFGQSALRPTILPVIPRCLRRGEFITTEPIEKEVNEYARGFYLRTAGKEVAILDCISFVRHFLHFFTRHRDAFLEAYQRGLLAEPDSAVPQILKETWLTLRQAAELRPEVELVT
jgi:hypothetical protein